MSHRHMGLTDRAKIEFGVKQNLSNAAIAQLIRFDATAIGREISRNSINGVYDSELAHQQSVRVRSKAMKKNWKANPDMLNNIESLVTEDEWSPDQIVNRCKIFKIPMVCRSRIYELIGEDRKAGGDIYKSLRRGGKKPNQRGVGHASGRGLIPDRVDISERPSIVDAKVRLGDFEIDTIIGAGKKSGLLTINDRITSLTKIVLLNSLDATTVSESLINCLGPNSSIVRTITSDNGKEFAYHKRVSSGLKCDYYFCQPYHSWERGLNENTNGLIRQYYPKGTDFRNTTVEEVQLVEDKLNNRPRKKLGYLTPREMFDEFLLQHDSLLCRENLIH